MTPEVRILIFLIAALGFAYLALYPRLGVRRVQAIIGYDLALTVAILMCVGFAYGGQGLRFSLLGWTLPWWAYTALVGTLVEIPFFFWFCRRWGIDPTGRDDP